MNPWTIIGWLVLALGAAAVASLIISWELERRRQRPPKAAQKHRPVAYSSTRNIRPGKETIYVHGKTSRGEYLLSFAPDAAPWVESHDRWQQRVKREQLQQLS